MSLKISIGNKKKILFFHLLKNIYVYNNYQKQKNEKIKPKIKSIK